MSIRSLRAAVSFLTVIPVASGTGAAEERLGRAYFPAVGAAVGLVAGIAFTVANALTTPLLAAALGVAVLVGVTGAIHLDGLADAADGLLGAGDRERRLEVMRDPRLGSYGVAAIALVLIVEVAALAAMAPARALVGLVIAGALSRLAVLALIAWLPYVRAAGLGSAASDRRRRGLDLAVGVVTALALSALDWKRAAVSIVFAGLVTVVVAVVAARRVGGATGDIYGASAELAQAATLLVFAVR